MDENRIARVHDNLAKRGLTQALIVDPLSIWWLCGYYTEPYERFLALLVPAQGAPTLFVNRLFPEAAASGARVIDDSYNAAPASMASSLDVLCSMDCAGRRIAVLGEMGELGDEAARLHGYVGAYAAAKGVDLLVLIGGELAAEVAEAARTMGLSEDAIESFPTVDDAVRVIGPVLSDGDLVLVKASRAAGLDAFVKGVLAL